MLKALIKKQFRESYRTYFVNPKTGKSRSKRGIIGYFIFFGFAILMLCGIFYAMADMLSPLIDNGQTCLYYAMTGIVSVVLGAFGSVFNTYASLYLSKDNDLLLAMPIPASTILISRMSLVFGLSFLYSGVVWLPALICGWAKQAPSVLSVIFGILLFIVISIFVTAVTCVLGWVIASIASRVKKKSFTVVFLSIAFFAAYYLVFARASVYLQLIVTNSAAVAEGMKKWCNLFYQLGRAAEGSISSMLLFTLISVLLCAVCTYLLSRSFLSITARSASVTKRSRRAETLQFRSVRSTLLRRELKRFTSSPSYMLNCGLGILFCVVVAIVLLIKYADLQVLLAEFYGEVPELAALLPVLIFAVVSLLSSMNTVSTPSVSLEGNSLWIVNSMPIAPAKILAAKLKLHIILTAIPAVILAVEMFLCMYITVLTALITLALTLMYVWLTGSIGLMIGVINPNVTWTTEAVALKGFNTLISMFFSWVITGVVCLVFWLLRNTISTDAYLSICTVVLGVICILINRWLAAKGAARFARI